ncbi:class I SAM-dependent methyltransferase [Paenibacillus sp. N1-5-1-14]|uniref:class I SAM-dependent methyltransferase n=1 Tax=Paenibacillus radicibacter TaxID=2972488 RepID=UPI00215930AF|nr:class I SAM-dependent methyltransferase [Paenibacillus radicibacter]MCR8645166.1 class I SAM-dependent methyltransferase [Paenibacillus radicibacter]
MTYKKREKALDVWNKEFESGKWTEVFEALDEVPRYSVVSGIAQAFHESAAILDLGCGQGMIMKYVHQYGHYVGVDFSEEALKLARHPTSDRCTFIQSDLEYFTPEEQFDLIIFNEILYYFDHPLDLLERYRTYLRPQGAFILSLQDREASTIIRHNIKESSEYDILSDVRITTEANSWTVSLIQPQLYVVKM